jgi:lycopene beta-cyclase
VLDYAKKFNNVTFKTEKVISFDPTTDAVQIETDKNTYLGNYVFNSTPIYYPELSKATTLLQHFKGWVIKTETEVFNPKVGTLMDFTVSQEHGDTFMYVLPTSNKEALIEYTLFTEKTIDQKDYETALSNYIKDNLGIEKYNLVHEEYGIIPMSTQSFNRVHSDSDRIIHLGTAGGSTKASSGYTFQFIQKHTSEIVDNLLADKSPLIPFSYRDKMFNWYDRTLLDIMIKKELSGKYVFSLLFKKNNPETLLTFLGNESTFWQELKIMWSTPIFIFLPSGIRRLFK